VKVVGILAAAMLLSSQAMPPEVVVNGRATTYFIDTDTLPRITCTNPPPANNVMIGTGVWIGSDRLVTANHVISGRLNCRADGIPIQPDRTEPGLDFIEMRGRNHVGLVVPYSCAPTIEGESYFAAGYSEAGTRIKVQVITAIGQRATAPGYEGQHRFRGSMRGGASGGAIFNSRGVLVGIVTAIYGTDRVVYEVLGVMLTDTPLCRAS
jgi:S1-C subfamily serine protease